MRPKQKGIIEFLRFVNHKKIKRSKILSTTEVQQGQLKEVQGHSPGKLMPKVKQERASKASPSDV